MTVSAYWYGKAIMNAFGGETEAETFLSIDYLTNDMKVMLCTSGRAPAQDTDETRADTVPASNEVTGTGYVARGHALDTKLLGYTAGTNVIKFSAANVVWETSTITARYGILYKDSGTDATSPLMMYIDFGQDVSSSGGDFTIAWDAAGICTVTPTAPA